VPDTKVLLGSAWIMDWYHHHQLDGENASAAPPVNKMLHCGRYLYLDIDIDN
jgi:hypothetical protein